MAHKIGPREQAARELREKRYAEKHQPVKKAPKARKTKPQPTSEPK